MKIDGPGRAPAAEGRPTGQENAALRHARNAARREDAEPPAVVVEAPRALSPPPAAYSAAGRPVAGADGAGPTALGAGATIKANVHVHVDVRERDADAEAPRGRIELGAGASLKLNLHARRIEGGGGSLVIGDGAKVTINAHVDALGGGGGTLVVPPGATLKLNLHAEGATGAPASSAAAPLARIPAQGAAGIAARGDDVAQAPSISGAIAAALPQPTAAEAKGAAPAPAGPPVAAGEAAPIDPEALRRPEARPGARQAGGRGDEEARARRPEDLKWMLYQELLATAERDRGSGPGLRLGHGGTSDEASAEGGAPVARAVGARARGR